MGRLLRFFQVLVLALVLPLWAAAQDEATTVFDAEGFAKLVERASGVVDRQQASTEALEQLRAQLSEFRSAALNQKAVSAQKVRPINERLRALGDPPAEGEKEPQDVASLRAELQSQIERARGPVLAAEDNYQQADGLIKSIDAIIRERNRRALLMREPTPLNPARWGSALADLGQFFRDVGSEIGANWENQTRSSSRLNNLPLAAILFGFALLLLVRARRWVRSAQDMLSRGVRNRTAAIVRFAGSLGQLVLPFLGLVFLLLSFDLLDLFGLRGEFLAEGLVTAGFILFLASWLARTLFMPAAHMPAFIPLSEAEQPLMRRALMTGGVVFALAEILSSMVQSKSLSVDSLDVLLFPLICVGAFALWRIGRVIVARARAAATANESGQFLARIGIFLGNFCVAAALLSPILGAFGYSLASQSLVMSTGQSLVVIAGFYVVFRFFRVVTVDVENMVVAAGAEEDRTRYGALFQVALGFAFICAALPILALIWGVRFSELKEVWFWLRDGVAIGETRISFADFLTFVLIFSVGYTATRLLQSALRSTVLPNTRMDIGGQNAIVTGTGYVGIFLAALAAITATGLDLSNLAIVAGALSVGIGFGLQTIVSNFVSGIILLIERPIKAGDWIEVGSYSGYVRKISVRSTEVETFDRASVVIPNADLIAGTVTNWTHSSMAGRVRVPVGVAYDSDPREVERILREVAEAHPMVLLDPGPAVIFMGFGADSMDFEIRAILRDVNWMLSAKSDMNYEIVKRFRVAGIEIPYAQRDVYIKNLDALTGGSKPPATGEALALEPGKPVSVAAMDQAGDTEGEPTP